MIALPAGDGLYPGIVNAFPTCRLAALHFDAGSLTDLHGGIWTGAGGVTGGSGGYNGRLYCPAGGTVTSSYSYQSTGMWMGLWVQPSAATLDFRRYDLFRVAGYTYFIHRNGPTNYYIGFTYPGGQFQTGNLNAFGAITTPGYVQVAISDYSSTQKHYTIYHSHFGSIVSNGAAPFPDDASPVELLGGLQGCLFDELEIYNCGTGTARAIQPTPTGPFADYV